VLRAGVPRRVIDLAGEPQLQSTSVERNLSCRRHALLLADFLITIGQLVGLLFIVTSMLAMGMSLTISLIVQPLKNARLVLVALLANFVLQS
jgi:predicted Na+-dependent transporter